MVYIYMVHIHGVHNTPGVKVLIFLIRKDLSRALEGVGWSGVLLGFFFGGGGGWGLGRGIAS